MELGLSGKKALVTGSTKGIGRAIVESLMGEGVEVAICARNAEERWRKQSKTFPGKAEL